MYKSFYRRNLPHQQPPGAIFFVTFSLNGAIPEQVFVELQKRAAHLKEHFKKAAPGDAENVIAWKRLFRFADESMDRSKSSLYLSNPGVAQRLIDSINEGQRLQHYVLHRYCVMGNHVHLLIEPLPMYSGLDFSAVRATWPPYFYTSEGRDFLERSMPFHQVQWRPLHTITKAIKRVVSPLLAEVSGRKGKMWMEESFDHWIRSGSEYERVVAYIDENPVKAGLCRRPEDWLWGMASK